jgi:hypothetical protein
MRPYRAVVVRPLPPTPLSRIILAESTGKPIKIVVVALVIAAHTTSLAPFAVDRLSRDSTWAVEHITLEDMNGDPAPGRKTTCTRPGVVGRFAKGGMTVVGRQRRFRRALCMSAIRPIAAELLYYGNGRHGPFATFIACRISVKTARLGCSDVWEL